MWHFKLTYLKLMTSSDILCRSIYTKSVQGAFLAFGANKQTRKKARASIWGGAKEVLVKCPGREIREPEVIGTGNGRNRK